MRQTTHLVTHDQPVRSASGCDISVRGYRNEATFLPSNRAGDRCAYKINVGTKLPDMVLVPRVNHN